MDVYSSSENVVWLDQFDPEEKGLNASERALYRRLRRDCWPRVMVREVGIRLANGALYVPAIVTAIERAITIWECSDAGRERLKRIAGLLPKSKRGEAIYYCTTQCKKGVWIDEDVEPQLRLLPVKKLAAVQHRKSA